jgi:predicted esterase
MNSNEGHIKFEKSGRFFTHGNPEKAEHIIIALHGYGQLASFFIRKFQMLDPDKYFVVCPEGLHRFYQAGTSGRVGASWMTKEDRLTDIADYVSFLDALMLDLDTRYSFSNKTLLGFSQGGATASRWIAYGKCKFDVFMLWAAVFPPDMDPAAKLKFTTLKNYFIIGTADEYTTIEKAKEYHKALNTDQIQFEFVKFEGNHALNSELLIKLLQ